MMLKLLQKQNKHKDHHYRWWIHRLTEDCQCWSSTEYIKEIVTIQSCNTDHFPGTKEANPQNETHSTTNELAILKQIITGCLICRISKIQKEFFKHTDRKGKPYFSQDGFVNLCFTFLLSKLSRKKKS